MRISIAVALVHGSVLFAACERGSDHTTGVADEAADVRDVVAQVAGTSIGASEVESLMAAEQMSAEEALQQLVDEAVLAAEAARRGLSVSSEGRRAVERRMVRSMLHDLEEEATPESVTEKELQEDYERYLDKYRIPELRRSWHLLVKDSSEKGRVLAASILRELRKADDPRAVFERYEERDPEAGEIEVLAEDLPAAPRKSAFERPFADALFEAKAEGPLNDVVETSYGWHAVFLAEIRPEQVKSREDVEEETRNRISQAKRLTEIVRIVQALNAEGLVSYDDAGVERLLAMEGLPERGN